MRWRVVGQRCKTWRANGDREKRIRQFFDADDSNPFCYTSLLSRFLSASGKLASNSLSFAARARLLAARKQLTAVHETRIERPRGF